MLLTNPDDSKGKQTLEADIKATCTAVLPRYRGGVTVELWHGELSCPLQCQHPSSTLLLSQLFTDVYDKQERMAKYVGPATHMDTVAIWGVKISPLSPSFPSPHMAQSFK